ncbi:MAG: hypothetical protein RR313_06300 [Anaerovoracaceae bacterium]
MNVMKFIENYENELITTAIILGVVVVLFFIIRGFVLASRKRALLWNINQKVEEISRKVGSVPKTDKATDQKRDVIYIDNRQVLKTEEADLDERIDSVIENSMEKAVQAEDHIDSDIDNNSENSKNIGRNNTTQKIDSRDCSVGRSGIAYTVEELKNQIK